MSIIHICEQDSRDKVLLAFGVTLIYTLAARAAGWEKIKTKGRGGAKTWLNY
jgi:hypothetical protein